jgi:choline kinase
LQIGDYLFNFFEKDFFDEIIVVGGFYYEDLKNHISALNYKNVRVIENKDFLKGNIFTLLTALKEFKNDSFLITNVDHIYPSVMFKKMKESMSEITAMCDFDRKLGADDMKVKLDSDRIKIEKISKQLDVFDCGYIGMTYVDISKEKFYRESVEKTIEKIGEKAVVENVLQLIAENNTDAPKICDLSGFGWYEVDTEEDLINAEKGLEKDPNFN